MDERIRKAEPWPFCGSTLLECFRTHSRGNLNQLIKVQLEHALKVMVDKYYQNEKTTRANRRAWRDDRIKLYNDLLRIALGAEDDLQKLWFDPSTGQVQTEKFESKLVSGSIYTYLLDEIIHEDEEIMFRFYPGQARSDKAHSWLKNAFWLVESIRAYRRHLCEHVADAFKNWVDVRKEEGAGKEEGPGKAEGAGKAKGAQKDKDVPQKMLDSAEKEFKAKVKSLGRDWGERSWRNRARLYSLLGLVKHTPIANGKLGKFKGFKYVGPIGKLVQKMIKEDTEMLSEGSKGSIFHYMNVKYDKEKEKLLGRLKICQLLPWASAANDPYLVKIILRHNAFCMKCDPNFDYGWEESWKESWASALWNASYKGHAEIVKELLKRCKFPSHEVYSKYFSGKKENSSKDEKSHKKEEPPQDAASHGEVEPPLHVAVRKRNISVVNVFCEDASLHFSCHEQNAFGETPLEIATKLESKTAYELAIKGKIQSILLKRSEVSDVVEVANKQRELTVYSANAIMVGATLVAGITFAGWLQPPLGFNSNGPYMFIQGHRTIQVFAIFNSLSFFFAIAAVIGGMETTCFIQSIEDIYLTNTVMRLQSKLKWTTSMFIISVSCVLIAFASAGMAILPPIGHFERNMYITIAIGGFACVVSIWKMLLFSVSNRVSRWTYERLNTYSKSSLKQRTVTHSTM